jgi:hypothetical protein
MKIFSELNSKMLGIEVLEMLIIFLWKGLKYDFKF